MCLLNLERKSKSHVSGCVFFNALFEGDMRKKVERRLSWKKERTAHVKVLLPWWLPLTHEWLCLKTTPRCIFFKRIVMPWAVWVPVKLRLSASMKRIVCARSNCSLLHFSNLLAGGIVGVVSEVEWWKSHKHLISGRKGSIQLKCWRWKWQQGRKHCKNPCLLQQQHPRKRAWCKLGSRSPVFLSLQFHFAMSWLLISGPNTYPQLPWFQCVCVFNDFTYYKLYVWIALRAMKVLGNSSAISKLWPRDHIQPATRF